MQADPTVRTRSSTSRALRAFVVVLPALVMAIQALVIAIRTPLWRDEAASRSFATLPLPDLLDAVRHVDAVLAPYYLVASAVQQVLPGDLGMRLPSVLAAVGSTVVVALLARRWWGDGAALAAGLAFALNPLAVTMASTARPYALPTLCIALAALALDSAVRRGARRAWAGYVVALAAGGLLHLFALAAVPALLPLLRTRRQVVRWVLATAAVAVLVAPVALIAYTQRAQVSWIPRPDLKGAVGSLTSVLDYEADGRLSGPGLVALAVLGLLAVATVALIARAQVADRAGAIRLALVGPLLLGLPWLMLLAVSLVSTPYLRTTYLAPSALGAALVVGGAIGATRHLERRGRIGRAAIAVAAAIPVSVGAIASAATVSAPWRVDDFPGLAAELQSVLEPGDRLVVMQPYNEVGVAAAIASGTGDTAYLAELQQQLAAGRQPLVGVRTVRDVDPLASVATDGPRADAATWVVYTRNVLDAERFAELAGSRLGCEGSARLVDTEAFGLMRLSRGTCD